MTKYHKQQAEIRYNIDGRVCQICGQSLTSSFDAGLAHRIPKTKINIRKFTENETIPDELKNKLRETETYINIYFKKRNRE